MKTAAERRRAPLLLPILHCGNFTNPAGHFPDVHGSPMAAAWKSPFAREESTEGVATWTTIDRTIPAP
jgi:hypothetical protein